MDAYTAELKKCVSRRQAKRRLRQADARIIARELDDDEPAFTCSRCGDVVWESERAGFSSECIWC